MSTWRKTIGVTAGGTATVAAVLDAISRLYTAEQIFPVSMTRVFPILYLTGFIIALLSLRRSQPEVDGVIYRENIEHRNRITELEKELKIARPREIPNAQRIAIAERLEAMPEFEGHGYDTIRGEHLRYRPKLSIGALTNAPDSRHLAEALEEILQFRFDVEWIDDKACLTYYSMKDLVGIVILEAREQWWLGPHRAQFESYHSQCAHFLVDSFHAEGLRINRFTHAPIKNIRHLTLLVGSNS